MTDENPHAAMVGIGLASGAQRCLSRSVPLDTIAYIISAKTTANARGATPLNVFVADNPSAYPFVTPAEVARAAEALTTVVQRFVSAAEWGDVQIVHAAEIAKEPQWKKLHEALGRVVPTFPELSGKDETALAYIAMQLADMAFMAAYRNVRIKIGWCGHAVDGERFFDRLFTQAICALTGMPEEEANDR